MDQIFKLAGAAFVPAGLIAAAFFVAAGFARKRSQPKNVPWDAIGVGVAFLWGYLVLNQTWFPNPSRSVIHWLPWAVLVGIGVSLLQSVNKKVFRIGAAVVLAFVAWVLIRKIVGSSPDWFILINLALGLLVIACNSFSNKEDSRIGWDNFLVFGLLCAAAIPIFLIAGSSKWAQVVGVVGVICIPGFLLTVRSGARLTEGATFLLSLIFWGLCVYVQFVTEYYSPVANLFLLALAPIQMNSLSAGPKMRRVFAAIFLVFSLGMAIWLQVLNAPPPSPYGY